MTRQTPRFDSRPSIQCATLMNADGFCRRRKDHDGEHEPSTRTVTQVQELAYRDQGLLF